MPDDTRSTSNSAKSTTATLTACSFDLVERASIALAGCVGLMNPDRDGQPYTYAELHSDPPVAFHAPWDYGDVAGQLLESLTLARIMTGSAPAEVDEALARLLASGQREDGLIVLPIAPWTGTTRVIELEWSQRGALMAWTTRYLAFDDQDALQRATRLVNGLHQIAVWEGDTCWFPGSFMPPHGWTDRRPPVGRVGDLLTGAQIVFSLVRFAAATGSQQALTLAHGLIRFVKERSGAFTDDGQLTDQSGRYFHSNTGFILGVLKYGLVTGRDASVVWARTAYDSALELGTDFGFFPHRTAADQGIHGDVCATTDMIEIALLLGIHVDQVYLAQAERFGRNHLIESQLLGLGWVEARIKAAFPQELWCANYPPEGVTTDRVAERAVGGFTGWSTYNDAFDPTNPRLIQRSTAAGTRALYDLWHYSVTRPEGAVKVNLHFSRDTRWATVTSYAPQAGRVDVIMKSRGVLAVRVPPGVSSTDIEVVVNNERPRNEILRGDYAWLEALQLGDMVTVEWPLDHRTMLYQYNEQRLIAQWRGDTLMRMEPPGKLSPLYRRAQECAPAPAIGATGRVKEIDTL